MGALANLQSDQKKKAQKEVPGQEIVFALLHKSQAQTVNSSMHAVRTAWPSLHNCQLWISRKAAWAHSSFHQVLNLCLPVLSTHHYTRSCVKTASSLKNGGLQRCRGGSHNGSVAQVLQVFQESWWRNFFAKIVMGINRQPVITINQGNKG